MPIRPLIENQGMSRVCVARTTAQDPIYRSRGPNKSKLVVVVETVVVAAVEMIETTCCGSL